MVVITEFLITLAERKLITVPSCSEEIRPSVGLDQRFWIYQLFMLFFNSRPYIQN